VACNAAIGSSVREKQAKERPCPPLRSPGHAGAPARGTGRMWQAAAAGTREGDRGGRDRHVNAKGKIVISICRSHSPAQWNC
jgi:hypothetical protein